MKSKTSSLVSSLLEINTDFCVSVSVEELGEILRNFRVYNEIPANLANLANDLQKEIGPTSFGGQNPNNGSFGNLRVHVGNEGSLVIYVESNLFYRKGDSSGRQAVVLHAIGERYKADEIKVEEKDSWGGPVVKARFWWD